MTARPSASERHFADLARHYRLRAGLTQRQLAARAGVDFTYLSKIESRRVPPPAREIVEAIAEASNLSVGELEEFVSAAGKIPIDLERMVVREREARRLLRSIQQFPEGKQEQILARLVEQVERDLRRGGGEP